MFTYFIVGKNGNGGVAEDARITCISQSLMYLVLLHGLQKGQGFKPRQGHHARTLCQGVTQTDHQTRDVHHGKNGNGSVVIRRERQKPLMSATRHVCKESTNKGVN